MRVRQLACAVPRRRGAEKDELDRRFHPCAQDERGPRPSVAPHLDRRARATGAATWPTSCGKNEALATSFCALCSLNDASHKNTSSSRSSSSISCVGSLCDFTVLYRSDD